MATPLRSRNNMSIWETYNGQIKQLRTEGLTLQSIGDKVGVSRERIRQILEKHYGTTRRGLLTRGNLASLLGSNPTRLANLEKRGVLHPVHMGGLYLYNRDESEKAALAVLAYRLPTPSVERICETCGEKFYRKAYTIRPTISPARFCSKRCRSRWSGKKYGRLALATARPLRAKYQRRLPIVEKECIGCGTIHTRRGLFCSVKCFDRIRALVKYYEGWHLGGVKAKVVSCSVCGVEVKRFIRGSHQHFCESHLNQYRCSAGERLSETRRKV